MKNFYAFVPVMNTLDTEQLLLLSKDQIRNLQNYEDNFLRDIMTKVSGQAPATPKEAKCFEIEKLWMIKDRCRVLYVGALAGYLDILFNPDIPKLELKFTRFI